MGGVPNRLRVGAESEAVFERRPALHSVRQAGASPADGALTVIPADASTSYAIYEGRPDEGAAEHERGPVYAAGPGGPLAVPTGRVLVRLATELRPEQRRAEFKAAGFEIERVLPYAPQAAWLRPIAGGVEMALQGLTALERIPGAVHVEPQMLLQRASKG